MSVSASLLAASAAMRAASLDLCSDEYLLLLARPTEIASLSRLAHDPADSVMWRKARAIPANRGRIEDLIGTRANLLVTMGGGARSSGVIAKRLGMATLALPYPATLDEVEATVAIVAIALGDPHRAVSWRAALAHLRTSPPQTMESIFLSSGGQSVGATSLSAQWMRLAGFAQRSLPGGRASLEMLLTAPPARLLRSDYRRAQVSLGQRWLDHPAIKRLASRTTITDGRPWTCAGPAMVSEIARLRGQR